MKPHMTGPRTIECFTGCFSKKGDEILPLNHHLEVIKSPNISSSWSYLPLYPYCKITNIKCETTYIPHDIPMNFRKAAGLCPPLLCTSAWLVHLHFPLGPTEVPHLSVTRRIYQTQNKKCVCEFLLIPQWNDDKDKIMITVFMMIEMAMGNQ